jgi:hypothetical protein
MRPMRLNAIEQFAAAQNPAPEPGPRTRPKNQAPEPGPRTRPKNQPQEPRPKNLSPRTSPENLVPEAGPTNGRVADEAPLT